LQTRLVATVESERLIAWDAEVLARALLSRRSPRSRAASAVVRSLPPALVAVAARHRAVALVGRLGDPFGTRVRRLLPGGEPSRTVVTQGRHAIRIACWPSEGSVPLGHLKVGAVDAEADNLERIAAGAAVHGVAVPRLTGRQPGAFATVAVEGVQAIAHVLFDDARVHAVVREVADWSHRWAATEARGAGVEALAPWLDTTALLGRDAYGAWLAGRAGTVDAVPLAPAHLDLTLSNLVVTSTGIGVLDWEEASVAAPAAIDLPYLVVDAVAARDDYADRLGAFKRCFGPNATGPDAVLASDALAPAVGRFGAPAVTLAFHCGWLLHARHERERGDADGPFNAILDAITTAPEAYDFGA
jgi:hypothetical protein